ncbi:hypothetical protein Emed_002941 [Eimeria media]
MNSLKLICLAGLSLACSVGADGVDQDDSSSIIATGSRVKCLDALNHYRLAAGFSAFTESDTLSKQKTEGSPVSREDSNEALDPSFLNYACESLQSESAAPFTDKATFAVHSQSGADADCSAAVEYWKGAIANFDSLPPEYQQDTTPYNSSKNVSFVALFNPKANAAVDCAYVTCQKKTQSGPSTGTGGSGDQGVAGPPGVQPQPSPSPAPETSVSGTTTPGTSDNATGIQPEATDGAPSLQDGTPADGLQSRRLAAQNGEAGDTPTEQTKLLVCATTPAALKKGERPFT